MKARTNRRLEFVVAVAVGVVCMPLLWIVLIGPIAFLLQLLP